MSMRAVDLIKKKRDGGELHKEEISFLISGHLAGAIPDYQMAAFLMAVYHKGMTEPETIALASAMLDTGRKVDLSGISGVKVDKHSTGGVGDKTSIILAPLMAAMGMKMPMIVGRGLGHTGGTLDKLASIPGFRTDLSIEEFRECIATVGCAIMGQSEEIAPSDRRLYALRDCTSTVESIPLIAASVMSKKLSEGIDALLLDVKTGSGAFMEDIHDARALARLMVNIGNSMGVKTIALITDMSAPLGRAVGNSLEIKECISALKGACAPDLFELTLTLAAWMAHLSDSVSEETEPQRLGEHIIKKYKDEVRDYMDHGDAFAKLLEMIDAQHGNPESAFNPSLFPKAVNLKPVLSPWTGYVRKLDARSVGHASMLLGAGRSRMEDGIDLAAGIVLGKKPGDPVKAGEPLAVLHTNRPGTLTEAEHVFLSGVEIGDREPARPRIVFEAVLP